MHLHDHFGGAVLGVQRVLHGHHAELDQICRRALHGRVDGGALGPGAARAVGGVDFGQVQPAAHHGLDIAFGFGALPCFIHVLLHAGVAGKILFNKVFRSRVVNAQRPRQAIGAHAVDQPEVDGFGIAALLTAHLVNRHAKHFAGGSAVHIQPVVEGFEQRRITADVGHDAQLNLAVVGARNHAARGGHKSLAHAPAFCCADGNVLQIGVVAAQAARDRNGLRVVRVHTACARQCKLGQLVGVSALEFCQAAVLQNLGRQREIFRQLFQHFFIGAGRACRRFFDDRQTELGKENVANLLGRTQVERLARQRVCLHFQLHHALAQLMALGCQHRRIDQHTVALNAVQRLAAGDFKLINRHQFGQCLQLRPECQMHIQRLVGVFARIFSRLGHIDLIESDLVHALAAQVFKADAGTPHVAQRQAAQPVRFVHFQHVALQQGVVRVALHLNAVVGEHVAVVLEVLAQLFVSRVLQPGLEAGQHLVTRQLHGRVRVVVCKRDVRSLARRHADADADDLGTHLVDGCGFGIQSHQLCSFNFCKQSVEAVPGHHRLVVAWPGMAAGGRGGLLARFFNVKQARC